MSKHDERDDDTTVREGDVLGLGGASVPKTPMDPSTEFDEESVAQRRARARAGEQEDAGPLQDTGKAGIDMGTGVQTPDVREK